MVLQLAAAERKKKGPQASELLTMPIANIRVPYMLRHTIVFAHDYAVIYKYL